MPSARHELRSQARAIPLVTVSLANGHVRQTRRHSNQSRGARHGHSTEHSGGGPLQRQDLPSDLPPPYDSIQSSSSSSNGQIHTPNQNTELVTASPSDADVTDAVLHLSRTLVSSKTSPQPKPASSSWVFMMIYSWTHTTQTATRLFHILTTKPSSLLKELQGQNEQALLQQQQQQQKRQRKSIQQLTEEEDRMEDDPDMVNGTATEMVSVSMMNTRTAAAMADTIADTEMQDGSGSREDGSFDDGDSDLPRTPKRRIDQYRNPFAPSVVGMDDQEDDEGWLGNGDLDDGTIKSNSVRLTATNLTPQRAMPDFARPSSLGMAMDPHQFETSDRDTIFDAQSRSSRNGSRRSLSPPSSIFNTSTGVTFSRPSSAMSRSSVDARSPLSTVTTSAAIISPTRSSETASTSTAAALNEPQSRHNKSTLEDQLYSPPESPSQSPQPQPRQHPQPPRHHHFHPPPDSPWNEDQHHVTPTSEGLRSSSASISVATTHSFAPSYVEELVS
ncbi:hypothetical protein EMPS_09372 [Entomortierella parvispora]|uniref:Uncharacterized protein n=1 Tax=Entomortierella parvispora TaxID=205924 RepID=A0A9P3HIG1_9FUNG|nr:hypothetical protein EMPS_09372 [Entomortierella parvispora]